VGRNRQRRLVRRVRRGGLHAALSAPNVRRYESADAEPCRRLWAELTSTHRALYDDPTFGGDDPGLAFDEHLAEAGEDRIWVAEAGGVVVGLAGLLVAGGRAELEPIVVAEAWRGHGVGRALAERVIAAARERGFPRVRVRPVGRNTEAIRFFHALGFDVLGRVDLRLDLEPTDRTPGERIAGREFRV
jgi:GNAT superfamily N-acetyltransferase